MQLLPHHTHKISIVDFVVDIYMSIVINFKAILDFKEISHFLAFYLKFPFSQTVCVCESECVLLSIELKLIQVWRRQCLLSIHPIVDEKLKMHQVDVGELAQRSRALAALLEVMTSIPIKHIVAHNHL